MHLIELKDISKSYVMGEAPPVCALKGIDLTIDAGDFVAIMGPSGSGKSTLLAILGLLDKSDTGSYLLLGRDVSKMSENEYARLRNRFLGFVFQMFNLLPRFDVKANSTLPFIYSPKVTQEDRKRVLDTIDRIGLGDRMAHRPNQLSGGQQQRVAIARALANDPLVILADEPTGNLDSKSAAEIIGILKDLNARGKTIIMVTHEQDLAQVALRTITMADGGIVADVRRDGSPSTQITADHLDKGSRRKIVSLSGFGNYLSEGITTLFTNKLRSFLSILGVLIGVGAVIAMLAIGTGAQMQVKKTLASLGTNLLMVRVNYQARGISMGSDTVTRFTIDDLKALEKVGSVSNVVPYVTGRAQVVYKDKNWNTSISGVTPNYLAVRNTNVQFGRFFSEQDIISRSKVAVIGPTVALQLFGDANPIGEQIRINRINFTVIGETEIKGVSGFRDNDDQIFMPYTTAMYRLIGTDYINYFDVQVAEEEEMAAVQSEVTEQLAKVHKFNEAQKENIDVRNMADIQKAMSQMTTTFTYLLGAIAAVSLLVGGIGIMNIMLVMVIERTREIGLRKALGAENMDIMLQFIVESVLICVVGGMLGILFGSAVSFAISFFAGWSTYISIGSMVLAFTFSVVTGLIFGLWPALRAAKLQPIIALRYE